SGAAREAAFLTKVRVDSIAKIPEHGICRAVGGRGVAIVVSTIADFQGRPYGSSACTPDPRSCAGLRSLATFSYATATRARLPRRAAVYEIVVDGVVAVIVDSIAKLDVACRCIGATECSACAGEGAFVAEVGIRTVAGAPDTGIA